MGKRFLFPNLWKIQGKFFSTNSKELEETKNKTGLEQENSSFEASNGAEDIENLSNQNGGEIYSPKSPANSVANLSTNSKELEETKDKTDLEQENLSFEASNGTDDI